MEHEHTEYERSLLRRALTPATSSASLSAKVGAINELFERNVPAPVERIRAELEAALATAFGTDSEMRSHRMAERLLRVLDGELADPPTEEDRLAAVAADGWQALIAGDDVEADRLHAQFAREAGFSSWRRVVARDGQRREDGLE